MSRSKKTAGKRKQGRPGPRRRSSPGSAGDDITIRLSFEEAAVVVMAANLAKGMAKRSGDGWENLALGEVAGGIIGKLHRASPALKRETRDLDEGIRTFLAQEADHTGEPEVDLDDDDPDGAGPDPGFDAEVYAGFDEPPELRGYGWLQPVMDAMRNCREIALRTDADRDHGERRLKPLGAGHIGDVAVAIGWSDDARDFAALTRSRRCGAPRRTSKTGTAALPQHASNGSTAGRTNEPAGATALLPVTLPAAPVRATEGRPCWHRAAAAGA